MPTCPFGGAAEEIFTKTSGWAPAIGHPERKANQCVFCVSRS